MAQHVRVQDVEMVALGGLGMRCTEALHCAQRCRLRLPGRERGLRERVCSGTASTPILSSVLQRLTEMFKLQ